MFEPSATNDQSVHEQRPDAPQMRPSDHPMKKVAVIGAGLCGLVTIKELIEESHTVICFEQEDDIGGAFYSKAGKYGAYDELHLTVLNFFMAFSSFLPCDPKRRYWTAGEYLNYLREFTTHFGLRKYIRFRTKVLSIEPIDCETWKLSYDAGQGPRAIHVDAVAICSGRFRTPRKIQFPGQDDFKGTIHHSYDYKSPHQFEGRDVVCLNSIILTRSQGDAV